MKSVAPGREADGFSRNFAGRLDKSELGFAERAVTRAVRAAEGDFRGGGITAWAASIAAELAH